MPKFSCRHTAQKYVSRLAYLAGSGSIRFLAYKVHPDYKSYAAWAKAALDPNVKPPRIRATKSAKTGAPIWKATAETGPIGKGTLALHNAMACLPLKSHAGGWFREMTIRPYRVDFLFPGINLVIEVDGETHDTAKQRYFDDYRDAWIAGLGLSVLRVKDSALASGSAAMDLVELLHYLQCDGKAWNFLQKPLGQRRWAFNELSRNLNKLENRKAHLALAEYFPRPFFNLEAASKLDCEDFVEWLEEKDAEKAALKASRKAERLAKAARGAAQRQTALDGLRNAPEPSEEDIQQFLTIGATLPKFAEMQGFQHGEPVGDSVARQLMGWWLNRSGLAEDWDSGTRERFLLAVADLENDLWITKITRQVRNASRAGVRCAMDLFPASWKEDK